MDQRSNCLSEDLSKLVQSGSITFKQAKAMMPKTLTPDLQAMVDSHEITYAQAVQVMSETQTAPELVAHCGQMVSTGVMTGEEAGTMMTQIQSRQSQKYIQHHKRELGIKEEPLLFKCWETRVQAIDDIKYHSTVQGKRVVVDRQKSGGNRVVMVCASTLSPDTACGCEYRLVLSKNRSRKTSCAKPWRIVLSAKPLNVQHCPACTSQARITYREAVKNLKTVVSRKLPSLEDVRDRIARDNNVTRKSVSPHLVQKTRLAEAHQNFADYFANWSKLDYWAEQLQDLNPGSVVHVDVDKSGQFKRMFVGLRSAAWVATHTGIEFSGVDGTFLKHVFLKKGCLLLLVTRDGNNKLLIIAWVFCLAETRKNYEYMVKHLKRLGYAAEYMNRKKHLLYSDRLKGIVHFEKAFTCGHAHCLVHIIKNCRTHVGKITGANANFHADPIHDIQQAISEKEFRRLLNKFRRGYPEAAQYLDDLPHEKVFTYALIKKGYTTHGHRTSNVAEIMNSVFKEARNLDCYRICDWILRWWGRKIAERQQLCETMTRLYDSTEYRME